MLTGLHRSLLANALGFSLAGALAAGGLMGGLALVLAELSKQQVRLEKRGESDLEIDILSQQIRRLLDGGDSCLATIQGNTFTNGGTITINHVGNTLRANNTYGLAKIVSLNLRDIAISGTTAEFNLQVTFEKTSRAVTGYKRTVRTFPLSAELGTGAQPTRCLSTLRDAIDLAKDQLCTFLGGNIPTGSNNCTAPANQCPGGDFVTGFKPDGSPNCLKLGGDPHTPEDRNCFFLTTYFAQPGVADYVINKNKSQFQYTSGTGATDLNKWNFCANSCISCLDCNNDPRRLGLEPWTACQPCLSDCPHAVCNRASSASNCTPCSHPAPTSPCPLSSTPGNSCPTSCSLPPCTGSDCPDPSTATCPPCSTCPHYIDHTAQPEISPMACPAGYTHRFVVPGDADKRFNDGSVEQQVSWHFFVEHYCCKEVPSP